jgi:hypothetical protein
MATDAKTTLALSLLALIAPSATAGPEIQEQPANVRRADVARVEWIGASAADVFVDYRHGLDWVTVASDLPPQDEGEDVSSASWQPGRQSPAGTYRIRIEAADDTLVSEGFTVRPCKCVIAGPVRSRWRQGGFRLRMKAEYLPAGVGEFKLPSQPVQTGRPLVRVMHDGHRIGSVRLRYTDGAFRGTWSARRQAQDAIVFKLVALRDAFGNR